MGKSGFHNGVHPDGHKELSANSALQTLVPTGDLVFPLGQHIGKPATAIVKRGDMVKAGQIIAEASGFISANIISSVSGKVKTVDTSAIVITSDGEFTLADGIGEETDPTTLSKDEIIAKIKAAGIVGLGGAGFPTHVKLMPQNPEDIDYVIANGTECEPYLTCDDRLMREKPEEIVAGLKIAMQLFPGSKGVVVIEDNKPEAIAAMQAVCSEADGTSVQVVPARYPQGGERTVIYNVTGRQLAATKLPAAVGCIVDNVATLAAIYQAVAKNTPLMEKTFTITGDCIANPGNYWVRIGTTRKQLVEAAGGLTGEPKKLILGGPMMGVAVADLDAPILRMHNGLMVVSTDDVETAEEQMTACIRCGRCVRSCPVGLYPQIMAQAAMRKDYERYEKMYGLQCLGCGSCTYICPAKRPLMQLFKTTKAAILDQKAKAAKEAK